METQPQAEDVLRLPVRNPERATDQIVEAVAGIFAKFPPAMKDRECGGIDPCL